MLFLIKVLYLMKEICNDIPLFIKKIRDTFQNQLYIYKHTLIDLLLINSFMNFWVSLNSISFLSN